MSNIKKETILSSVAPCALFCSTCTGCQYGDISYHSKELLKLLEGHKEFLDKNLKQEYRHKLDEFNTFEKKLKKYAYPKCGGCRNNPSHSCTIKNCNIAECTQNHNVNFCADCTEFPCNNVKNPVFKDSFIEKWIQNNRKIKEIGIEEYYKENKNISHYINHIKEKI